jgi:hypothetical protein
MRGNSATVLALLLLIVVAASVSCGTSMPTAPIESAGSSVSALPAPLLNRALCGSTARWPDGPISLVWEGVNRAASYTVEIDCERCAGTQFPWFSQSGTPWHIRTNLTTPRYDTDAASTLRRDGGHTMRWRVWAVDAQGGGGTKADWCVLDYSTTGERTPGAETP